MKVGNRLVLPALLVFLVAGCDVPTPESEREEAAPAEPEQPDEYPQIALETNMGRIVMELDRVKAPKTVNNFLVHVRSGFYDSLTFHRVLERPIGIIQAGVLTPDYSPRRSPAAFLDNEGGNRLENVRGAVAMARGTDPHSAKAQFFINVQDNPQLNTEEDKWGWAVFGRVIDGMDVVEAISKVKTRTRGTREDIPVEPITIERCYILPMEEKLPVERPAAEAATTTG